MDFMKEIDALCELNNMYNEYYTQQKKDVQTGKLPGFQFARDNVMFEAECFMKMYATSSAILHLAQRALNDDSTFLESSQREHLSGLVASLNVDIPNMEKYFCERLYKAYEDSF